MFAYKPNLFEVFSTGWLLHSSIEHREKLENPEQKET